MLKQTLELFLSNTGQMVKQTLELFCGGGENSHTGDAKYPAGLQRTPAKVRQVGESDETNSVLTAFQNKRQKVYVVIGHVLVGGAVLRHRGGLLVQLLQPGHKHQLPP